MEEEAIVEQQQAEGGVEPGGGRWGCCIGVQGFQVVVVVVVVVVGRGVGWFGGSLDVSVIDALGCLGERLVGG